MRDGKRLNGVRKQLDDLYARYHRREFIHADPLEFIYRYEQPADREIVGLIASSLAYGRVAQILASVSTVLERMPSPSLFVKDSPHRSLRRSRRNRPSRAGWTRVRADYGNERAL